MNILVRLSIDQEVSLNSFIIEKVADQNALVEINSGFAVKGFRLNGNGFARIYILKTSSNDVFARFQPA